MNIRQLNNPQAAENYAQLLYEALPSFDESRASTLLEDWSKIRSAFGEISDDESWMSTCNEWFDGDYQQAMEFEKADWKKDLSVGKRENLKDKILKVRQIFRANDTQKLRR